MSASSTLRVRACLLRETNRKAAESRRFKVRQFDLAPDERRALMAEVFEAVADALDGKRDEREGEGET